MPRPHWRAPRRCLCRSTRGPRPGGCPKDGQTHQPGTSPRQGQKEHRARSSRPRQKSMSTRAGVPSVAHPHQPRQRAAGGANAGCAERVTAASSSAANAVGPAGGCSCHLPAGATALTAIVVGEHADHSYAAAPLPALCSSAWRCITSRRPPGTAGDAQAPRLKRVPKQRHRHIAPGSGCASPQRLAAGPASASRLARRLELRLRENPIRLGVTLRRALSLAP